MTQRIPIMREWINEQASIEYTHWYVIKDEYIKQALTIVRLHGYGPGQNRMKHTDLPELSEVHAYRPYSSHRIEQHQLYISAEHCIIKDR